MIIVNSFLLLFTANFTNFITLCWNWHHLVVRDASELKEYARNPYRWNFYLTPRQFTMRSAIRCTSFGERRKSKETNREFSHSKCREGGGGLMKERDLCIPCKWRAWIIHSNKIMQSAWESRTLRLEAQKRSGIDDRDCCNIEKWIFLQNFIPELISSRESFVSPAREKCIHNYWCIVY